ncbi:MAG: hypothetical protein IKB96_03260 [Prevotella sp.]|nr:hypothetical protein [Prevotella sp.]
MTPDEFVQKAMIHVGAALVKVYDEKCDGIVDNDEAQNALAKNAIDIAQTLLYYALDGKVFKQEYLVEP